MAANSLTLKQEMRKYFRSRGGLYGPEAKALVADVVSFLSGILKNGFEDSDRPFIEISDAIVQHHLRLIPGPERELVGKSLSEAYIYYAGRERVFEPAKKTKFVRSLKRLGVKSFAALFLSLHLSNITRIEMEQTVRARLQGQKDFELYALQLDGVCRNIVASALKVTDEGTVCRWVVALCGNIESELRRQD